MVKAEEKQYPCTKKTSGPTLEFLLETSKKSANCFKGHSRAELEKQSIPKYWNFSPALHAIPPPLTHTHTQEYKHKPAEIQHIVLHPEVPTNLIPTLNLYFLKNTLKYFFCVKTSDFIIKITEKMRSIVQPNLLKYNHSVKAAVLRVLQIHWEGF